MGLRWADEREEMCRVREPGDISSLSRSGRWPSFKQVRCRAIKAESNIVCVCTGSDGSTRGLKAGCFFLPPSGDSARGLEKPSYLLVIISLQV